MKAHAPSRTFPGVLAVAMLSACYAADDRGSSTHRDSDAPRSIELDYKVRCDDCNPSIEGPEHHIAVVDYDPKDSGVSGLEAHCRVVQHESAQLANFSIRHADEDDASNDFSLEVKDAPLNASDEDSGDATCLVVASEGDPSRWYPAPCSTDAPSQGAPCQLDVSLDGDTLSGTLLCSHVHSGAPEVASPMGDEPLSFELHGCGTPDLSRVGRRHGGDLSWVRTSKATDHPLAELRSVDGSAVATFPDGGIWAAGYSDGNAFLGSEGVNPMSLDPFGGFLARYDADGALDRVKRIDGGVEIAGIAAVPDSSFWIAGSIGNTDARFGPGETNETIVKASIRLDAYFVARYEANGTLRFVRAIKGRPRFSSIAAFADGSVSIAGSLGDDTQSVTFGPGESNETTLTTPEPGLSESFVARYANDGSLLWTRVASGDDENSIEGVSASPDGSSLVTGGFTGALTLGSGEPHETTVTRELEPGPDQPFGPQPDVFVAKFDAEGSLEWLTRALSSRDAAGQAIATRTDGSALVTGYFTVEATFGAGEKHETTLASSSGSNEANMFLARYSADGKLLWAKHAGWASCCLAGAAHARAVALLKDGSALVGGEFDGYATFGRGEANETTLIRDAAFAFGDFVARYAPDGRLVWATHADASRPSLFQGLGALPDGAAIVVGSYEEEALFGPGEANEARLVGTGDFNFALARFGP